MKNAAAVLAIVAWTLTGVHGQLHLDVEAEELLDRFFPDAADFSERQGNPPHFKALDANGELIGFGYWTTDVDLLERGFDGPIKMFVAMDTDLILRGIMVTEHREPFGDFSVDLPAFAAQFEGKDVRDPFRYGGDIDAIARATISITSASRAVRNSSRRIARALLAPQ